MNCLFTLTIQTDDEDEDGDTESQSTTRDTNGNQRTTTRMSYEGQRRRLRRGDGHRVTDMGMGRRLDSGTEITSRLMSRPRVSLFFYFYFFHFLRSCFPSCYSSQVPSSPTFHLLLFYIFIS
jgi:hypothetical protein